MLDKLPKLVKYHICLFLSPYDLIKLSQVNKIFNIIYHDNYTWKIKILKDGYTINENIGDYKSFYMFYYKGIYKQHCYNMASYLTIYNVDYENFLNIRNKFIFNVDIPSNTISFMKVSHIFDDYMHYKCTLGRNTINRTLACLTELGIIWTKDGHFTCMHKKHLTWLKGSIYKYEDQYNLKLEQYVSQNNSTYSHDIENDFIHLLCLTNPKYSINLNISYEPIHDIFMTYISDYHILIVDNVFNNIIKLKYHKHIPKNIFPEKNILDHISTYQHYINDNIIYAVYGTYDAHIILLFICKDYIYLCLESSDYHQLIKNIFDLLDFYT